MRGEMSFQSIYRQILKGAAVAFALFGFLTVAGTADAAPKRGYEALMTQIPGAAQLTLAPGERTEVEVAFQNIGEKAWVNDGKGYVSIYTYRPKYRRSVFDPGTWLSPSRVKRLIEPRVEVGRIGTIRFELDAPEEEGTYEETFHLAAEDAAWIPGGEFTLPVRVVEAGEVVEVGESSSGTDLSGLMDEEKKPRVGAPGYDATVLLRSAKKIATLGGASVTYTVGVKNAGTAVWLSRRVELPDLKLATSGADLLHASWLSSSLLALNDRGEVKPGELDFVTFTFTAPRTVGEHLVAFTFIANGERVEGGEIVIPVDVTSNAPDAVLSPLRDGVMDLAEMIPEPVMRVGVLIVDEETDGKVQIVCDCEVMAMKDENGNPLADVPRGVVASAYYAEGKYFYDAGRGLEATSFPIRFVPDTLGAILTVTNFDRRVTRGSEHADNQFRNVLELRHNTKKNRAWLVNELPMEMYLRGLAETSNSSPIEYQKAIVTAARTYAYYHFLRQIKHAAEGFMVDAWRDQVYKGYGSETRLPSVVSAVEETYGVTVTYDGQTAITPYFGNSDGRTRSWSEVWSGEIAWLKSVDVPCDANRKLFGHGVGMSARGAICMADDGMGYRDILKYFYTGVDLRMDWNRG